MGTPTGAPTSGVGAGLNNGLDGSVVGNWIFKDFYGTGTGMVMMILEPSGVAVSTDGLTIGTWSTDHNGLPQPAACIFITLCQIASDGTFQVRNQRLNLTNVGLAKQANNVFPPPTDYSYDANLNVTQKPGIGGQAKSVMLPPSF